MEEKQMETVAAYIAEKNYSAALSALEGIDLSRLLKNDALQYDECAEILQNNQAGSIRLDVNRAVTDIWLGKTAEAQATLQKLMNMQDSLNAGSAERAALENQVQYLLIFMPSTDNARMLMACSVIRQNNSRFEQIAPRFSSAVLSPSILRGTKDLSDWGKNVDAVGSMLCPVIEQCFSGQGRGVLEAAKAEWYFEKNKLSDALLFARFAAKAPDPSIAFVGYAVLLRLAVVYPEAGTQDSIQQNLETFLKNAAAEWLMPNFDSFKVRMSLLMSSADSTDLINSWLETIAVNPENADIPYDRYALLTKGHVLSAAGKTSEAISLFDALIASLDSRLRPLDFVEALCGKAVAEMRNGSLEQARHTVESALETGFQYGYLRTFAEWLFPAPELLQDVLQDSEFPDGLRSYAEKIQKLAEEYQSNTTAEASLPVSEPEIAQAEPPADSPPPEEHPKRSGKKAKERQNAATDA